MKTIKCYRAMMAWGVSALFAFGLAACDSGSEPILGGGGIVAEAVPMVTVTVPRVSTPLLSGVAVNSRITATFSKDMDSASINTGSFVLACPAGTPITGTVSYVASSRVATFTPASNLPAGTVCVATLNSSIMDSSGRALPSAFSWQFVTAVTADATRPAVALQLPLAGAVGVATNSRVTATFSEPMDAATLSASTFTVTGPGMTAVAGTVSYASVARTATFTPAANLPASTLFTATLTSAITDLAGNGLAGNPAALPAASNHVWTFTTGAAPDTTAPTVSSLNPADVSTGICLQKSVNATFNEAMDPLTLSTATFSVRPSGPPAGLALSGTVSYDAPSRVVTFNPVSALLPNTAYTANLTTGVRDLAGNGLAAARSWSFTSGAQACSQQTPVVLGAAAPFGALGGTAGTTNTGILTLIDGDISTTATVTSAITGLHDTAGDIYTQTGSNQGTVNGTIYSCTVSTIGPTSAAVNPAACTIATEALSDAQTAFDNLSPASLPGGTDPGAGQLGGLTLAPGIYMAAGGSFMITGSDLTLDAQGDANAVWVFQTASTLDVGAPGAPRSIILVNGAQAKNIFWQVGSSATINAAGGGTMVGTILASSSVSFSTVGNVALVTLNGRAIGLNASVTMTNTIINVPAP